MVICEGRRPPAPGCVEGRSLIWILLGIVDDNPSDEEDEDDDDDDEDGIKLVGSLIVVGGPNGDKVDVTAPPIKRSKSLDPCDDDDDDDDE